MGLEARRHTPTDVEHCFEGWGANCGPASLAAAIGLNVAEVRPYLEKFEYRKYMNPTHMKAAMDRAGVLHEITTKAEPPNLRKLPKWGVVFLQFSSDEIDAMPIGQQYRHTHWFTYDKVDDMVYDVNCGWAYREDWRSQIVPRLIGSNGSTRCYIRTAYEVL